MTREKKCPLCDSKTWNYDLIVDSALSSFCGDCWFEVRQTGLRNNMLVWSETAMCQQFVDLEAIKKAVAIARAERGEIA